MNYGYYPGCSLEGISTEYDISMRSLLAALDIAVHEIPDWICCGTLAAPSLSPLLGLATPLWNVLQAKDHGINEVIAPCSECLYHFKRAAQKISDDPKVKMDVAEVLGGQLDELPRSIHPLELLYQPQYETMIKNRLVPERDLADLKAVTYYGCHISRPAAVMEFDEPENPVSMDHLVSWAGVEVLEWKSKVDCCGAHFSLIRPDYIVDLCQKIFAAAVETGADVIVVACPMCHANLDTRQEQIAKQLGVPLDIPVLYFSQVIGYAIGLEVKQLGFEKHIVDPLPLMLEKCHSRKQAALMGVE
ncbi:MAG: CoB--CoM heterodisulfide reductase iron-sulfur subunit B family protein [Anaerolineae bacterium]|nr:CoB--CoM heterodisulfide reductase iron-sulfur subunit B family protein [Anaerolineae bacterium]